jgi:C-terminal processing protease CtpA/Prc
MPFPKRVAVLVDNAASTGEQFLLEARQSRKVTLFGKENSAGVLDFSNTVDMPTPSGRYRVFWATSRSLRLPGDPVDPDGIAPDIRIPADERDPVAFAQRWLERQVD